MAVFPFQYVNRRGIPVIKTTGVTVNAADVVFSFQNHAFANSWYRGIVLVELSQAIPAGTTGTLPVLFETNGVTKNVTTYNGANVTVSDIPGTGVFQLFYVPVNADMVTKDGLTVTTSRERLIDAINAAKQQSQSVVDSYEKHKANLEVFDQIMREVNPAYAGQAQRDKELQELRAEVGQLRQMQTEFASMKSSLDAFLKSQMSAKTSKS